MASAFATAKNWGWSFQLFREEESFNKFVVSRLRPVAQDGQRASDEFPINWPAPEGPARNSFMLYLRK